MVSVTELVHIIPHGQDLRHEVKDHSISGLDLDGGGTGGNADFAVRFKANEFQPRRLCQASLNSEAVTTDAVGGRHA